MPKRKPHTKAGRRAKFSKVMREFKAGTLRSSSGQKVTNPAQARAIGISESGTPKRKRRRKSK